MRREYPFQPLWSTVSFPSKFWGGATAENKFWCILSLRNVSGVFTKSTTRLCSIPPSLYTGEGMKDRWKRKMEGGEKSGGRWKKRGLERG